MFKKEHNCTQSNHLATLPLTKKTFPFPVIFVPLPSCKLLIGGGVLVRGRSFKPTLSYLFITQYSGTGAVEQNSHSPPSFPLLLLFSYHTYFPSPLLSSPHILVLLSSSPPPLLLSSSPPTIRWLSTDWPPTLLLLSFFALPLLLFSFFYYPPPVLLLSSCHPPAFITSQWWLNV